MRAHPAAWNPVGRAVPDLPSLDSELIRFETAPWDAIDARLRAECDLALGRFAVLRVIGRHGLCRVQDIADEPAITISGTSKIVERNDVAGDRCRHPNPDDQRSSVIALTPAGQHIFAQATDVFAAELARRFGAVLSARSLEQSRTTLTQLRVAGHRLDHRDRKKEPDNRPSARNRARRPDPDPADRGGIHHRDCASSWRYSSGLFVARRPIIALVCMAVTGMVRPGSLGRLRDPRQPEGEPRAPVDPPALRP